MNDHMWGFNIDVNAIYLMAYFVAGLPGYMRLSTVFLVSFWEWMFLKESPIIKTPTEFVWDTTNGPAHFIVLGQKYG